MPTYPKRNVVAKRTLKYLAVNKDKKAHDAVIAHSPDSVVRLLSDVSLNALKNPKIHLSSGRKKLFKHHRASIAKLASPDISIATKRRILQKGGFAWIPAIISAALGALGSTIFGGANKS
jgi:hypothetical protein